MIKANKYVILELVAYLGNIDGVFSLILRKKKIQVLWIFFISNI